MVVYLCVEEECRATFMLDAESADLADSVFCPACKKLGIEIGESDTEWVANAE